MSQLNKKLSLIILSILLLVLINYSFASTTYAHLQTCGGSSPVHCDGFDPNPPCNQLDGAWCCESGTTCGPVNGCGGTCVSASSSGCSADIPDDCDQVSRYSPNGCTADTGYQHCDNSYTECPRSGDPDVYANLSISNSGYKDELRSCVIDGQTKLCTTNYKFYYSCLSADKIYFQEGVTPDTNLPCGRNGCTGTGVTLLNQATDSSWTGVVEYKTPRAGIPAGRFICWDRTNAGSQCTGAFVWIGNNYGYNSKDNVYVVSCVDDTDCSSGQYCDTSGSWDTWQCKTGATPPTSEIIQPAASSQVNSSIRNFNVLIDDSDNTTGAGIQSCEYRILSNEVETKPWTQRPCDSRVFVTSSAYTGDLGGLPGADSKCLNKANDAQLCGPTGCLWSTWIAWLSDSSTPASSRIPQTKTFKLVDNTLIANKRSELTDGVIRNRINKTETGGSPPATDNRFCSNPNTAWTGTNYLGNLESANLTCSNWTNASSFGLNGYVDSKDGKWTAGCRGGSCSWQSALYCFEDKKSINITIGPAGDCRDEGTNTCTIEVRSTDKQGNISNVGSRSFSLDLSGPTVSISRSHPNPTNEDYVTFTATATPTGHPLTSISIYLDASGVSPFPVWTCPSSPCVYVPSGRRYPLGTHTIYAVATDQLGNSTQSVTDTFTVVSVPPDIVVTQDQTLNPSGELKAGDKVKLLGWVRNQGGPITNIGNIKIRFCIDNISCNSISNGMVSEGLISTLAPGASNFPLSFQSGDWTTTSGSHTFYLCADVDNVVAESNEVNCYGKGFIVTPAISPLGSFNPNPPSGRDIFVSGNYAYVLDNYNNNYSNGLLEIINVSNPSSPVKVSSINVVVGANDIFVSGNYAYIVSNGYGGSPPPKLQIINISNPASPSLISSTDTSVYVDEIFVIGNYAYIASSDNRFLIYNISNPASPTLVSSMRPGTWPFGLYVLGNYAYIGNLNAFPNTEEKHFRIVNVTNPSLPTRAGGLDLDSSARYVQVSGNYAYVLTNNKFNVINVSNLASPTLATTPLALDSTPAGLAVLGSYAFVLAGTNSDDSKINIYDISNPATPTLSTTINLSGRPYSLYVTASNIYVMLDHLGSTNQMQIFTNPRPPTPVGTTPCTITSGSWGSLSAVNQGTSVNLNVQTSGSCSGKQVEFKVWESDGVLGSDPASINPTAVSIATNNTAQSTWTAEYQCDGLFCIADPPEYYFEANIVGESTKVRSNDPELQVNRVVSPTPAPIPTSTPTPTPTPAFGSAPTLSSFTGSSSACFSSSYSATLNWSGTSLISSDPLCANGFWVDISTESDFSNVSNKCVTGTSLTTNGNDFGGPGGSFGFQLGGVYYARVYNGHPTPTDHSNSLTLNVPNVNCITPTVQTAPPTSLTTNSAILSGNVLSDAGSEVTERGFYYRLATETDIGTKIIADTVGTGVYSKSTGNILTASSNYQVRAYAINSGGISYGDWINFTTPTPTPTPSPTPAPKRPPCGNYGDVTLDGFITQDDSTWISQHIAGTRNFTIDQKKRADVNGDNNITNDDVVRIEGYLAGTVANFSICQPITISNISISNIQKNSATISWKTSYPGTHKIIYGTSRTALTQTVQPDQLYDITHILTLSGLQPAKLYFYKVQSENGAGLVTSPLGVFRTRL